MKKTLILITIIFFACSAFAEEKIANKALKAAGLSLIIPGGGQLYNGKYTKSAVVFALESTLIGLSAYNISQSNKWFNNYETSNLETDYEQYIKYYDNQQNYLFWLGSLIFVSAIDAFVDAHLKDYEKMKKNIHLKFEDNAMLLSVKF